MIMKRNMINPRIFYISTLLIDLFCCCQFLPDRTTVHLIYLVKENNKYNFILHETGKKDTSFLLTRLHISWLIDWSPWSQIMGQAPVPQVRIWWISTFNQLNDRAVSDRLQKLKDQLFIEVFKTNLEAWST